MSIVKLNNRAVRSATEVGTTTALGSIILIKKLTASSSATLSFVDGSSSVVLDNTYKEYLFIFNDIHPQNDDVIFQFQGNASGGSGYDETITSSAFNVFNREDDTGTTFGYHASSDLAQGTGFQTLCEGLGADNDHSLTGWLKLFNPSSTTYVKHWTARTQYVHASDRSYSMVTAGYFNTTSAIDEIQFKMDGGDIDAGDICLYGIN